MLLVLVRHGNALDHDIDALRQLSDQGKKEANGTGLFLKQFLKELPANSYNELKVFHSELVRAKETAMILSSHLTQGQGLEEAKDLLPNSPISPWLNNLIAFKDESIVVLTGHMPYMGIFASELSQAPISIPTGGCLIFERTENNDFKKIKSNF
jgi:phosphohistidine phosphatase SixA